VNHYYYDINDISNTYALTTYDKYDKSPAKAKVRTPNTSSGSPKSDTPTWAGQLSGLHRPRGPRQSTVRGEMICLHKFERTA
jgi:hypothetical protein